MRHSVPLSLSLFAEQNGNVKRPSVWSCWPRQVITLHSKDYTVVHRTSAHGHMLQRLPHLAKGRQQHHHPPPICTIVKQRPPHYRNHYHIVCIQAYRPWAHWAVYLVQVRPHSRICQHPVRCLRWAITTRTAQRMATIITAPQMATVTRMAAAPMAPNIRHDDRRPVQHWIPAVRHPDEPRAYRPAMTTTAPFTFEKTLSNSQKRMD